LLLDPGHRRNDDLISSIATSDTSRLYKCITLANDVVADYVPPPQSLLPAQTLCMEMEEDPINAKKHVEQFKDFQKQFEIGHSEYLRVLPVGKLRDAVAGPAYSTAQD